MEKKQSADKTMVYSKLIVGILLSITLVLFAITAGVKRGNFLGASFMIVIALTIVVFFIGYTRRELKSVREGFPVEDERSSKVMALAGYKAFLISIYWILIIGWASSNEWIQFRDVSQATGAGILGMAIIFGLCWLYYNKKEI
jgi:uncharacterized membrane protein